MKKLIVGLTGASGAVYGVRLLEVLQTVPEVETHLIVSQAARQTLALETAYSLRDVQALADVVHDLSLIHISEPTRQAEISYAVFCLKKKKRHMLEKKNTREGLLSRMAGSSWETTYCVEI